MSIDTKHCQCLSKRPKVNWVEGVRIVNEGSNDFCFLRMLRGSERKKDEVVGCGETEKELGL